ncbi:hypothetical protein PM082_006951 [Marasmius tenuissimus]|nr:hypothetical protein PM082_006951 [Marasmius tenuissimus]
MIDVAFLGVPRLKRVLPVRSEGKASVTEDTKSIKAHVSRSKNDAALDLPRGSMGSIIVHNASGRNDIQAFVSKYCDQGSDAWYRLDSGQRESWGRKDGWWEFVAFKDDADTQRAGKYVRVNSTVTFHDFNKMIVE